MEHSSRKQNDPVHVLFRATGFDLERLRRQVTGWNPHARGVLVDGDCVGVRCCGEIVWLTPDGRCPGRLVQVTQWHATANAVFVRFPPSSSEPVGPRRRLEDAR